MQRSIIVGSILLLSVVVANAQASEKVAYLPKGSTFTPKSSVPEGAILAAGPGQQHAHTNVVVFLPEKPLDPPSPSAEAAAPAPTAFYTETPASIGCIYKVAPHVPGCNPNLARANPKGGSKVIAIVDAYDAPNARRDLEAFSKQFGLPQADFEVRYAAGQQPARDEGWELEISLDVQWAHAMAPDARIVLVEAKTNRLLDLEQALDVASDIVAKAGGGEVSNSWGSAETSAQAELASHLDTPSVVYFTATGDTPPVESPSSSANTVAVGGTTINRTQQGEFIDESGWSKAGAGQSQYVPRPAFQDPIAGLTGKHRGVPDVSAVADPQAGGVWVYDPGYPKAHDGWVALGGTSAATPIVAGLTNAAGRFAKSSDAQLKTIYSHLGSHDFNDVRSGTCGTASAYHAGPGWDFCSGVGSPAGTGGL